MPSSFPANLRLVLKLLSMSSAQLAKTLGVDKSVTSRWLSGAAKPSDHNMQRLTALVAERVAEFQLVDWDRDPETLAGLFPAPERSYAAAPQRPAYPTASDPGGLSLTIWDQAVATSAQRGRAYEGFFRTIRPADDAEVGFAYDYSWVRMADNGLLRISLSSLGSIAEGWLLTLDNQLFMIVSDSTSGSMTYSVFNGLASTKVDALDGVGIGAAHDPGRTPTALAFYSERIGDLCGDEAEDERRFKEWARINALPTQADLTEQLLAHILPNFGPAAHARGGDWLLQIRRSDSLSRSAPVQEQIAAGPVTPRTAPAAPATGGAPFSEKLSLVLKLLSLSGAQLASALEVDKSVISRWLSGAAEPSPHNLARLTVMIAVRTPGFNQLDWERTPEGLVQLFGADPAAIPGLRAPARPVLNLPNWEQIVTNGMLRGPSYEGFFRITRPSTIDAGDFILEYGLIQTMPSGLPRFRLATVGARLEGWMLPLHDQIHFIACDPRVSALMFGIFNGVAAPKVQAVDGVTLGPSQDVTRAPTAMAVLSEHVEDLSGDPEADERRFIELAATARFVSAESLPEPVKRRLLRDCGPVAYAAGGDMLLQMPLEGSLSRAAGMPG